MKEFIEKLIAGLKEISVENTCSDCPYKAKCDEVQENINDETTDLCGATIKALSIEIVNQLAEEYSANTPQKSANGWIPCSEMLPDEHERVLVTYEDKHTGCGTLDVCDGMYIQVFGGIWSISAYSNNECFTVLAWMPLPAPYQPKGEKNEN